MLLLIQTAWPINRIRRHNAIVINCRRLWYFAKNHRFTHIFFIWLLWRYIWQGRKTEHILTICWWDLSLFNTETADVLAFICTQISPCEWSGWACAQTNVEGVHEPWEQGVRGTSDAGCGWNTGAGRSWEGGDWFRMQRPHSREAWKPL